MSGSNLRRCREDWRAFGGARELGERANSFGERKKIKQLEGD
jgi:hypothetical protein